MDPTPLVKEMIDEGAVLAREFNKFMPVAAAFWATRENDLRHLYIAADRLNRAGTLLAYREMDRIIEEHNLTSLDPMRLKAVGSKDPLAREAVKVNREFPDRHPNRLFHHWFGVSVDDVYVYRPRDLAPAADAAPH